MASLVLLMPNDQSSGLVILGGLQAALHLRLTEVRRPMVSHIFREKSADYQIQTIHQICFGKYELLAP